MAHRRIGLVLSGGGARGAYEAGVVLGITEALRDRGVQAEVEILSGTSVGAINAAFLASKDDLAEGAHGLAELWRSLRWAEHLKVRALDTWRWLRGKVTLDPGSDELGPSIFDVTRIQSLVWNQVDWEHLHRRIEAGRLRALIVAALHVGSGRTCLFGEFAPGFEYPPSKDPHRYLTKTHLGAQHVLASAAIPALFPARRVDGDYYCDGGLRFNAPLAPALRAGAEALIVVNTGAELQGGPLAPSANVDAYPSPGFLASRVLNALLLDRVPQDLESLRRINDLWHSLRESLDAEAFADLQRMIIDKRGAGYREVEVISFHPTRDPGELAAVRVQDAKLRRSLGRMERAFIDNVVGDHPSAGDLVAYLLFDGEFAGSLIEVGRQDALAKGDELARLVRGN